MQEESIKYLLLSQEKEEEPQMVALIDKDEFAQNPQEDIDEPMVFMVYDHSELYVTQGRITARAVYTYLDFIANGGDEPSLRFDNYEIYCVYAYIHSGIALSLSNDKSPFNDRWDVSTTGYMLVDRTLLENKEYLSQYENESAYLKAIAEDHLKLWNQYLSGDTYYIRTKQIKYFVEISKAVTLKLLDEPYYHFHAANPDNKLNFDIQLGELEDSIGGFYGLDYKTNGILEYIKDVEKEFNTFEELKTYLTTK